MSACVIREVAPGDHQYVPVREVPSFKRTERFFIGVFNGQRENLGPNGSHTRTICLPVSRLEEFGMNELDALNDADRRYIEARFH